MREPLKPTVLTLAMLLPRTFIFSPWASSPETPVHILAVTLMIDLLCT